MVISLNSINVPMLRFCMNSYSVDKETTLLDSEGWGFPIFKQGIVQKDDNAKDRSRKNN